MDKNRKRGERRYQTWRHSRRTRRIEHFIRHGSRRRACDCPASLGRYRKAKALSCRCLGKQKGAPKLAGSMHKSMYKYRTTVIRRIWNRRLAHAWHASVGPGEPDDIELPCGPTMGRGKRKWGR